MITKLETQRLILRKPKLSDWKDIVEGAGNLEVSKMTENIPYPYSKKDAVKWIKNCLKNWGNGQYPFSIELRSEKKVIGCMGLAEVKIASGKAMTGSWINRKYQRRGYITEAKISVNNFAFDKLKLRKLKSSVIVDNLASNKTQQRVGYKIEGLMKKDTKSLATGKIHDLNLYGLLKEDWKKNLPKVKKRLNEKIEKLEKTK